MGAMGGVTEAMNRPPPRPKLTAAARRTSGGFMRRCWPILIFAVALLFVCLCVMRRRVVLGGRRAFVRLSYAVRYACRRARCFYMARTRGISTRQVVVLRTVWKEGWSGWGGVGHMQAYCKAKNRSPKPLPPLESPPLTAGWHLCNWCGNIIDHQESSFAYPRSAG
ncbi:uncharacterized protein EV422DRAFT_512478 [Fimicolochytrium jonesii]|uniref:uncharacterized protein n=1 Tax=Fimicolochytrium jonesii TaxID=1396493 RepID=UPI0022FEB61F|nr:uncharacterized protein EV422DRAFT_512478 [Fimicolochytrium jonesii]KAI8827051.1 hypothetical protein EV422DRAFT_512478 [Fimicolochytrium jonesii]